MAGDSMDLTQESRTPKFTDVFIKRPVLAVVVSVAFVLVGLRAVLDLPILQYPQIESSSLIITTPYVGASAEVVQGFITDPIERASASVPGVDYVDSRTTAGLSTVTVWLKLNEDSTRALAELSARLDQIRFELPQAAEDPAITVQRADRPYAGFYLDVKLTGSMRRAEVTDYLTRRVNPLLAGISGVQRVVVEGGRNPAMRVWLDPRSMAMFGVSSADVELALTRNNIIATIGRSKNANRRIDLMVDTSLQATEEFEQMVIREAEGIQIRLRDIARIELGEEEGFTNARIDQDPAVYISVWPLPGSNEIDIANDLYVVLDRINPTLPGGMQIGIGYDVTTYMRNALREISITLVETVLLVGLVVIALMGSLRTALVPLVAIPISLLGTAAAMSLMGFSLNLLTVLAIVLSVGLVVDDAIVVVENVARHMRNGMGRKQAALASSRQLLTPIIGMTITLAAVYAPIGFLSGLTGVLFKEFAFALAVAVLISGCVALTLSPIMSAYVCPEGGREGRLTRWVNQLFERVQRRYANLLQRSLSTSPQVLTFALFFSLLMVPLFLFSQKELAPTEDRGEIAVVIEAPPEASVEYTTEHMADVVAVMSNLPGAKKMWQVVSANGGFGGMELDDFDDREFTSHELYPRAFAGLSGVAGLKAYPVLEGALPTAGNFDVEMVVISSDEVQEMMGYAQQLVGAAFASGLFLFADTDLKIDLPQGRFKLDRERIADLGMDLAQVSRQLGIYLSGNYVNRFDLDGKAYQVIPMLQEQDRPDPGSLLDLEILTPSGDLIPLSAIAQLDQAAAPRMLGKFQQNNAFRIYGGVVPGFTKEQALSVLENAAVDILPPDYAIDYAGESRQLRQEGNTLIGVLGIALAFVYLVLAAQFNSFADPLVVLAGSVPLAVAGALLFSFLGWTTVNIYSQVGFITLVGLISKNAILIVEFANQLRREGLSKLDAIGRAATTRLRPVLMTTGATVLGHFPLVLVVGAGAQARNSIGIVLVAGMLVGTVFTLFVLPSVYMVLSTNRDRTKTDNITSAQSASQSAASPAQAS